MPKYTIAFAGKGESAEANTKDLLNDFLGLGPEDADGYPEIPRRFDVEFILPLSDTHVTEAVLGVMEYADYARAGEEDDCIPYLLVKDKEASVKSRGAKDLLGYAEAVDEADNNVNLAVIDQLKGARDDGREALLFLFWDDEDDNCEILLDAAHSNGIKAYDLAAGLDNLPIGDKRELVFGDQEPEPEPEPEPEEKPARRSRRRAQTDEDKPLEQEKEPDPEKPATRRRRGAARTPEPEREPFHEPDEEPEKEVTSARAVEPKDFEPKQEDVWEEVDQAIQRAHEAMATRRSVLDKLFLDFTERLLVQVPPGREFENMLDRMAEGRFWADCAITMAEVNAARDNDAPRAKDPAEEIGEAVDKAVRRGRGRPRNDGQDPQPRTAAQKAKTEIWNEETEEWEPKGRGRVPKGAKTRLVDPKTGDVVEG